MGFREKSLEETIAESEKKVLRFVVKSRQANPALRFEFDNAVRMFTALISRDRPLQTISLSGAAHTHSEPVTELLTRQGCQLNTETGEVSVVLLPRIVI